VQRRPNRVFGYLRVSGSEQGRTGTSLDGQRDAVARWCSYLGYPEPAYFVEVASAGAEKLEQRVELRRLLEVAEAGDLIVVSKVDRWSRDIVWGVQSVRALIARGVAWHSIGENLDASTPQGDSTLGIMAWVADQERQRIKERTVGRRKELRDAGLYIEGRVPIGYERHERRLRVVEADAAIVREVYRRSIEGASVGDLSVWLRRAYPDRHGWDHKTIQRMLRSRVYLGEVTTSARAWVASHEPIVDRLTWEEAQAALDARRLGGRRHERASRTSGWLLRGIAVCAECASRMGAAYSRFTTTGGYYACRARMTGNDCDAPYVPVSPADAAVARLVLARLRALRGELAKPGERQPAPAEDAFTTKRDRLLARRERTVDLAADGTITRDDLAARLGRIDAEIGTLQVEEAAEGRRAALRTPRRRAEVLADLETLETAWRRATVEQRREILRRMARCVRLHVNHPPAPTWLEIEEMRSLSAADVNHLFEPPDAEPKGR
jgi:DNA invertase Pin-like site-specific DNA recombinase